MAFLKSVFVILSVKSNANRMRDTQRRQKIRLARILITLLLSPSYEKGRMRPFVARSWSGLSNADFVEQASVTCIIKAELISAPCLDPGSRSYPIASTCKQRLFLSVDGNIDFAVACVSSVPPNGC